MQSQNNRMRTNQLVTIALLSTIAYVIMAVGRIPMIQFLKYDPKDIVIMVAGMAYGPGVTILISIIVSFIEFITVSGDGIIGLFMNILSTVAFVTTATIIYKRNETAKNLIFGLFIGTVLTTIIMVAWNYVVTPIFLQIPRAEVVKLLLPAIVPFNLIKSGINTGIIILIYKPILDSFRRANLVQHKTQSENASIFLIAVMIISSAVILLMLIRNM